MEGLPENFNLQAHRDEQLRLLKSDPDNRTAMAELICADALLCKENAQDLGPAWRNKPLCQEIVRYVPMLIDEPGLGNMLVNVCAKAADYLYDHPRLKLQLLELQRRAGDDDADLQDDIAFLEANIRAADEGRFSEIKSKGTLRHDTVEWTQRFEDVIADARRKADERLADMPRGMGFCHGFWHELADILRKDYGIAWRSPAAMNPRVLFD